MNIKIYTDGACKGNPGPGGYGCILSTVLPNGKVHESKRSGGYRRTTNNRMELAAVIFGLMALNNGGHDIEIISDSSYVCNAFNKNWIESWRRSNWKNRTLPNRDMWQTLNTLISMQNSVKFTWVKGHNGNPYNEECDRLAVAAAQDSIHWEIDVNYENGIAD